MIPNQDLPTNEDELFRLCRFAQRAVASEGMTIPELELRGADPLNFSISYRGVDPELDGGVIRIDGDTMLIDPPRGHGERVDAFRTHVIRTLDSFRVEWRKSQGLGDSTVDLADLPPGSY